MATYYYDQFGKPVQFVRAQQTQQPQYQTQQPQYQPTATAGYIGRTPYQPASYEQPRADMYMPQTTATAAPPPAYGYPPDRYPLRQPRIPRHSDSPMSRRKKKSTTRKLVEGGLVAGLGIAASTYLSSKTHHTRSSASEAQQQELGPGTLAPAPPPPSGTSHGLGSHGFNTNGPIMSKVLEGVLLTAEGVGMAHLRKSRETPHEHAEGETEETDPRLKRLVEGALATAGAIALAYHDQHKKPRNEHDEV